jgi:poly-gamma-glutamate synthesis protein (capsule biosynthesis protein)
MLAFPTRLLLVVALAVLLVTLLAGCQPAPTPDSSLTPTQPAFTPTDEAADVSQPLPSATAPVPTDTPAPGLALWLAPELPPELIPQLEFDPQVRLVEDPAQAAARLAVGAGEPVAAWTYALVAPFPTIPDGVSAGELQAAWQGTLEAGPFAGLPLWLAPETLAALSAAWGPPAQGAVQTAPAAELLDSAWAASPAWGIVPFDALEPRWKVLAVDGQSPLHADFDPGADPLTIAIGLEGAPVAEVLGEGPRLRNYDPDRLTTVMLTGVTALVRATAETMRRYGNTWPAEDIGPWLRAADILHINNEVPFDPDCPQPDPSQSELVFCSRPEYLELLTDIGTDVVDLSGDHFADAGPEAMVYTLDLYQQAGLPFYGGGYTEAEARQPFLVEHNGNKIALLGCNAKGGGYATARGENPGAWECDYDYLAGEIARLKADGYLPIVTVQHFEYYSYDPQPKLIESFHRLAEDGAVIISGSQAHQPHGMEFYEGAFIHYGLGNLFFDQYHFGLPTGHAFLDRHVIYDGRHISTELLGIRFIDFARSRPVTEEERQELLRRAFEASLW